MPDRIPRNTHPTADLRGPQDGRGTGRLKAILVLAATLAFVISPYFTGGFAGFAPDLFPIPQIRPPVQPAGYAFSIWGLIYVWLVVSAGYGLLKRADAPDWDAVRWPLIASLVIGSGWIGAANTNAVLATVMIWGMLITALWALWRAPARDRWWLLAPLAIYAGWLTAASFVSVGLMLGGYGVFEPRGAALVALGLAVVFALTVQIGLRRAPDYAVTFIWALVGVLVANSGTMGSVFWLAAAGLCAALVSAVWVTRSVAKAG